MERPRSLLKQLGPVLKLDLIKDKTSVAISQIVKETMSVRSGNALGNSIIFMPQVNCAPKQGGYCAFARFSCAAREVWVIARSR